MTDPVLFERAAEEGMYQKCPVCEGRQTVPADFYRDRPASTSAVSVPSRESCRTCSATGIVSMLDVRVPYMRRDQTTDPTVEPYDPVDPRYPAAWWGVVGPCGERIGVTCEASHVS